MQTTTPPPGGVDDPVAQQLRGTPPADLRNLVAAELEQLRYAPGPVIVPPADPVLTLTHDNLTYRLMYPGNFGIVSGRAKSGKGLVLAAILAAALNAESLPAHTLGYRVSLPPDARILHIDTEQADHEYRLFLRRTLTLAGLPTLPERLYSLKLRNDSPARIIDLLQRAVQHHGPWGLVVIDGMLDLVDSPNDEAEVGKLWRAIGRLCDGEPATPGGPRAPGTAMLCVVHANQKATSGAGAMGHLGSYGERKMAAKIVMDWDKQQGLRMMEFDGLRSEGHVPSFVLDWDAHLQALQVRYATDPTDGTPARRSSVQQSSHPDSKRLEWLQDIFGTANKPRRLYTLAGALNAAIGNAYPDERAPGKPYCQALLQDAIAKGWLVTAGSSTTKAGEIMPLYRLADDQVAIPF